LHVLSLPPAFVLSQDQTLKLKDLISTKSLRKLTEYLPSLGFPKAVYSPKHRQRSMYLTAIVSNRPQGHRRLRFSFSSSLVKEPSSPTGDEEEPQTARPSLGTVRSLKRSGQTPPQWPAVDEPYLSHTRTHVNTKIKEICFGFCALFLGFSVFRQSFTALRSYSLLRVRYIKRPRSPDNFSFSSEEPCRPSITDNIGSCR
jgi:hypothetical protein